MRNIFLARILVVAFLLANIGTISAQRRSEKRGISENLFSYEEEVVALSAGATWYYNWGATPNATVENVSGPGKAMEFYPMAWNGNFNESVIRSYLTNHPGVKYLLGFNEPNFIKQANMTPKEAADLWPRLEKIAQDFDLKLVGPALNYSPDAPYNDPTKWYDEFFALLPEDSQIDFLALHCYMITSDAMMGFINNIAERYGKQIWLTEFCAWDNLTYDPVQAQMIQRDEMVRKVEAMELSPNVYKYSWFKARGGDTHPYYALLKYKNDAAGIPAGTLTDLGEVYLHMSSFDLEHYYTTTDIISATNYVKSEYISLEKNTDPESTFRLQLGTFGGARSVDYLIEVPEDGIYPLTIRIACEEFLFNPTIEVYENGVKVASKELPETGGVDKWDIRQIEVPLTAGKQRITLKSTKNTTCKINWISFNRDLSSMVFPSISEQFCSFRKADGKLYINSSAPINALHVFDPSGRVVKSVSGQDNVEISSLSRGVYFIKVLFTDGTERTEKFIN